MECIEYMQKDEKAVILLYRLPYQCKQVNDEFQVPAVLFLNIKCNCSYNNNVLKMSHNYKAIIHVIKFPVHILCLIFSATEDSE